MTEVSLGKRLAQLRREKAARERRDIPQNVAAEEIGVSAAAYSRWESDLRKPNDRGLDMLARYFDTTVPFIHYGVAHTKTPTPIEVGGHMFTPNPALDYRVTDEEHAADEREYQAKQRAKKPPKRA